MPVLRIENARLNHAIASVGLSIFRRIEAQIILAKLGVAFSIRLTGLMGILLFIGLTSEMVILSSAKWSAALSSLIAQLNKN